MGRVHIKQAGVCWTMRSRDGVCRGRPFGRRNAIVIAVVSCCCEFARLRYRAISRRYDNRRVAASAIDIAISPNR